MHDYFYKLKTLLKLSIGLCQKIGRDSAGNTYFQDRYFLFTAKRTLKRWVLYKGIADGSKIPPEWYGWIHYTTNEVPNHKTPSPINLSATPECYSPSFEKKSNKSWTPD